MKFSSLAIELETFYFLYIIIILKYRTKELGYIKENKTIYNQKSTLSKCLRFKFLEIKKNTH
jgi:hypothetical protein